ncbi:MAG TPA: hypothetical protein VHD56_18595 [Tepidisphaeraceae bacterium]|nr:hypothetical protein [Tepidisphaeraceae bacterium]
MRFPKGGLIFLLLLPAMALAQVSGSVESIGFDSYFRPDCWTPMVITVTPETSKSDTYEIHVRQQDLDRDLPIFVRTISVTGMSDTASRLQRFRMYFSPTPTDGGLPDARDPGSLQELQDRLKVSLHKSTGNKEWICDLPITGTLNNVDPVGSGYEQHRGSKLIIAVSDGRSRAIYQDATSNLLGVMEDVNLVTVHPRDLPEQVLGFDAADAIIWLDADPAQLKLGGDDRFRAIETFVRRGGRLVICQPFDWQKILAFGELLPVTVQGIDQKDDLAELRLLARPSREDIFAAPGQNDPLAVLQPPFRFARAQARPNTHVRQYITWKTAGDITPYIVDMPYGLGEVTWVAQDLGDPSLTKTRNGWIYVWNNVFDWKNHPLLVTSQTPDSVKFPYETANATPMDIGKSLIERWMDLRSKSAWLITLAILFFLGYWLISGPGSYTYLATRKRTHLSWFVFGLCALGATALTILMVKLVLRGPPELKHFSVVRMAPDQPAIVTSRIGLYIPRDGQQRIELKDTTQELGSTISALPMHPFFLKDVPEQAGPEYTVPVLDAAWGPSPGLSVPYRSTLKKFQATWVGHISGAVQGSAKLEEQNFISGNLTNGTGQTLKNIYIAFHYPAAGALDADWILFIPEWATGVTLDLAREFNRSTDNTGPLPLSWDLDRPPNGTSKVRGRINLDWGPLWTSSLGGGMMENTFDDTGRTFRVSLPMLSFFDRLEPMRNRPQQRQQRLDLLRRGGRELDMSASLMAGDLVVLAETEGPLPIPLEVEGEPVTGSGLTFYQFALPLDHSALLSTTQPSAQ